MSEELNRQPGDHPEESGGAAEEERPARAATDDELAAAVEAAAAALDDKGRPIGAARPEASDPDEPDEGRPAGDERADDEKGSPAGARPVEAAPEAKGAEDAARAVEEWRSRAYRAAADLENTRKRFAKEREDLKKYAVESLLRDLLPVADNLQRAVAHAGDDEGPLAQGVQMVLRQLLSTLERHGATPFDPQGEPFDPQYHEAMTQIPRDDVDPGTIVEVFQQGWMLHDRLARPAMVVVARRPDEED